MLDWSNGDAMGIALEVAMALSMARRALDDCSGKSEVVAKILSKDLLMMLAWEELVLATNSGESGELEATESPERGVGEERPSEPLKGLD
jgi:hypothetical protein